MNRVRLVSTDPGSPSSASVRALVVSGHISTQPLTTPPDEADPQSEFPTENDHFVDEKDIKMQYAYGSIQDMYIKMVLYVLDNQSKTQLFRETDLEKLSRYLSDAIMLNIDWMDELTRRDIREHVQKVMDNTSSAKIKKEYQKLLDTI